LFEYCSVHVPPHSGNLEIGLINEPAIPDTVATRSSCFDEFWCEALYPPVDGDVIDLDTAFSKEFLDIAVGQPLSEVPTHSQQNHLGWKPVPGERSGFSGVTAIHPHTLAASTKSVNATEPTQLRNHASLSGTGWWLRPRVG
jgi:hypothetical protein